MSGEHDGVGGSPDRSPDRSSGERTAPFRRSGSGDSYEPEGNWAAERETNRAAGPGAPRGMEGAASGAGDGGFGPEGDYEGKGRAQEADVLGQVHGNIDRLVREAKKSGPAPSGENWGAGRRHVRGDSEAPEGNGRS